MRERMVAVASSASMVAGLAVLSEGFRDLPIDERPEWMIWQMVLWPIISFGLMEIMRLARHLRLGRQVRIDRFRLAVHGVPALAIAASPAGLFTYWFHPGSLGSLLDFPTAKVMAAVWLAFTLWSAWEVEW